MVLRNVNALKATIYLLSAYIIEKTVNVYTWHIHKAQLSHLFKIFIFFIHFIHLENKLRDSTGMRLKVHSYNNFQRK